MIHIAKRPKGPPTLVPDKNCSRVIDKKGLDIVGSALVQNHGCSDVDHDHVGYRCEKYGCGQTGNCSLGPRGIEGDPIFPCTVGRLNYWENFEENLPQVEECPNKDCEPSFLTDIALSNYENDMIVIIINFTVPPASFPMNYYPSALSLKVSSDAFSSTLRQYLDENYHRYPRIRLFRFESSLTVERYLEFPCILMPREVSGLEYRLLNLNLTVFSFKTPLKSGAGNLTVTLQYNVTILSDNVDKDGIKIIAVARYPSQNDLLVVFNRVDGAKSYIVRAVDKDTGDVWGDPLEIYNSRTKLNCSFSGIAFGNVEIEITVVKYGAKKKPVKSLPIYFGVKSVPEEREDSVLVDATTVVLSAASAVVLATILVVLLLYFRRTSKRQKSLKPPGLNPKIVLMYSNKQRENTDVAIAFSDFLKKSFATENIVYEDDEKEKVELSQHINLWYERKITWCSHVIVIWFPGAEKTSENDYRQNHFPKTLSRVKEKCRNSDKNIICVYFDGISKLRNIPADLRNISKIICFPNEYDCLYQNVTGRKVPNNQSLSNMRKLSQNFPFLHRALEDAKYFYKVGISKTPSQSTTISSSNKSSQFGESFSSTISEIDPNCPIHGKHVQFNLDKKIDKSSEKDKKEDFIEVEDDVLSDIHPPSQDDLGSMSSLQLLNAMLEINNMNDDTEQKAPLLSEQTEAPLPTSDQGCKETRKCLRSAQRLDSEPSISSNDKQNSGFPNHSHDGQYDDLDIHEKEPLLNNLSSGCVNRQHKGQGHYRHLLQDPHYHQHPHFYVPTFENGTVPQIQNNRYSECRKKCRRLQLNHSDVTTHLPGHLGPSEMTPYGHGPLGPLNMIGHGPGPFRGPVEIHGPLSPTEMAACGNGPLGPLNIIDHVPGPFRRPVEIHGPPSPSKMTASGNGPLSPLDMTSHEQRSVNGPLEINRPISPLEMTPCGNGPLGPLQMISCGNGPLGPLQMISHGQQFFNDPLEIQGPLGPSGMTNHRRRNLSPSRETFRQNGHTEIANHEQIPLGPMQIDHAVSRHQHCPRQQVLVDSIEADRCGFDFQPPSDDSEPENDLNEMTTSLSCSLEQQSSKDWKDMDLDEKIMHFNS
ncbi:hypothetical protein FSP39_018348 [Pinctada imbricata]|uniref:SEFIR domain-containing protein n=1 Tax=Pinctada imbricata TaxID=66713 RepID=A0AA88YKF4_PINIB|nr:hypothetical protein FSP39_018348 [Pinctada imbricata]